MSCSTTQRDRIVKYCEERGSITIREAFINLGINSPTKRISELRHDLSHEVTSIDECNGETHWKRYFIKKVEQT